MKATNSAPFTHGLEVEQFDTDVPARVNGGPLGRWRYDGSGPIETVIGPTKSPKHILSTFYAGTRDHAGTWEWRAADGSPGDTADGAGSHVHICLTPGMFEDDVEAWTIAYNTVVELAPFLAPFFCHDWQNGFRSGTNHSYSGRTNIQQWAAPQLTRYSQSTVERLVRNGRYSRTYNAVTFNGVNGDKPVTIELRLSDAHPAFGLTGAMYLRRIAGCAIEGGWSPKLRNRRQTLQQVYDLVYETAMTEGLHAAMDTPIPGGIVFEEGRGIPRVEQLAFETPRDVLRAILSAYPQTPHGWSYRVARLVRTFDDDCSPTRNHAGLWDLDAPADEFVGWTHGPEGVR